MCKFNYVELGKLPLWEGLWSEPLFNIGETFLRNNAARVSNFLSSHTDIVFLQAINPLTVLLVKLWFLFLPLFQVEWFAVLQQLKNLLTWGQGTKTTYTIDKFRQMHLNVTDRHIHTVLGHQHNHVRPVLTWIWRRQTVQRSFLQILSALCNEPTLPVLPAFYKI